MRAARVIVMFVVPLAIASLLGVLSGFGALQRADGRAWDSLLHLRPAPPVPRQILLVDIDAQPGSVAGLLADGLVTFKEMDARAAVLVLPLAQRSPPSLDPSVLRQTLPNALDREFSQVEENIQSLFDAIRRGSVRPRDAARYVSDLVGLVAGARDRLSSAATGIERDDDALLGRSAAFFGSVYVPLDLLDAPDPSVAPDLSDLALQRQSVPVLVRGIDPSRHAAALRPAVPPLVRGARGGGFLDDQVDPDGVRRRVPLLAEHDGRHVGQIAFAAALSLLDLGDPAIEASVGRLVLRGSRTPAAALSIPLTESGDLLLAWPSASTGDGFRHLRWSTVSMAQQLEDALVSDLRALDSKGYLSYLRSSESLLDVYEEGSRLARGMLAAGTDTQADAWRAARQKFFNLCGQFLTGDAQDRIVADANRQIQGGAFSEEEKSILGAERDRVPAAFDEARQVFDRLTASRDALRDALSGSWCIVSVAPAEGVKTTTVTPFGAPASDAQASAALLATLVSGRFLREAPPRAAVLAAGLLSLLVAGVMMRLKPLPSLGAGVGTALAAAGGLGLLFTWRGIFIPPALPLASMLASAVALSFLKLGWKRAASRRVRAAFSGRVSAEGMRDIDAARPGLALDGALRTATVMCMSPGADAADSVESPSETIRLLRTHREAIAEAVLGLGGMLLESGSRVSAVFGTPLPAEDHARRAFLASLRVREMERELNGPASHRFSSSIGIHTGHCVAGLLGPGGLPVYGLAGDAPETAARLEALHDVFSTSIIVSERAREAAGAAFLLRVLGVVPVGGSRMRVLELLAERDSPAAPPADLILDFEEGVARFERGAIPAAFTKFTQLLSRYPSDGPSRVYALRCRVLLDHPGLRAELLPWGPATSSGA